MSKSVVLTDVNDEQIFPINTASEVQIKDGYTLRDMLDDIEESGSMLIDSELSDTSTNAVQNRVIKAKLDEVFQSVSNGKELIASAITDKGVETNSDATFTAMAENIGNIQTGGASKGVLTAQSTATTDVSNNGLITEVTSNAQ